jgi:wyosine [tRNA(Phe)-imidazoG37] synthetase (radical SAM superfamily)
MRLEKQVFYKPEEILNAVQDKLEETRKAGEKIDYLTFVPDGEPTLDINLEREIDLLKPLDIPVKADWVSLKIDTVEEKVWRKVDRPHRLLKLSSILEGALEFAKTFKGKLMTETMLLANVNDADQSLRGTAEFLSLLQPTTAYLSIPTRPPAEKWAQPPDEHIINRAYQIFKEKIKYVEYLTGYEGNAFAFTGDVEGDILSITAVHPMRNDAVEEFLKRAGANWEIVHRMIEKGLLIETEYGRHKFYLRRFVQHPGDNN